MKKIYAFLFIAIWSLTTFCSWASADLENNKIDSIVLIKTERGAFDQFGRKNRKVPGSGGLSIEEYARFEEDNKEQLNLLTDSIISSFPADFLNKLASLKVNTILVNVTVSPEGQAVSTTFYISKRVSRDIPYQYLEIMDDLVMQTLFKCNFSGHPRFFNFSFSIPRSRIKKILIQKQ